MELITIKESHFASDLLVIKSKLESEGIKCFLKDELTSQIMNHIPSMSAKLQVYGSDLNKVNEILNEHGENEILLPVIVCPICNSENIQIKLSTGDRLRLIFKFAIAQLTFSSSVNSNIAKKYICMDCNHIFN